MFAVGIVCGMVGFFGVGYVWGSITRLTPKQAEMRKIRKHIELERGPKW